MFQGKLFLRAYDLTSSDKPFRSEAPRKPLCLYLKTVDKVVDLLSRSGSRVAHQLSDTITRTPPYLADNAA